MKKTIVLLAFSFLVSACSTEIDGEEVDVVIVAGQSNAAGVAYFNELKSSVSKEEYKLFEGGFENQYITSLIEGCSYEPLQKNKLGFGAIEGTFGPEIGISSVLKNKTIIIKYAWNGAAITTFSTDSGLSQRMKNFIDSSLSEIKKEGYVSSIKAFCWIQGEADSQLKPYAPLYYARQKKLIGQIRELYGENLPFIDVKISTLDWSRWVGLECCESIVIEAKEKI